MNFASVEPWAYMLIAVVGLCFGVLQSVLLKYAVYAKQPRKWFFAIKFGLWAIALLVVALISLLLLVVFAGVSSITLLVASALLYHNAQKEAR